eukprot:GHVQ01014600.1.p1 GENE.GHVQ01014600.1~~GHVQ01014600.1.p1  ORF type:complete len:760 (+),score=110.22 GHVQ01014600.1:476-2755(+)
MAVPKNLRRDDLGDEGDGDVFEDVEDASSDGSDDNTGDDQLCPKAKAEEYAEVPEEGASRDEDARARECADLDVDILKGNHGADIATLSHSVEVSTQLETSDDLSREEQGNTNGGRNVSVEKREIIAGMSSTAASADTGPSKFRGEEALTNVTNRNDVASGKVDAAEELEGKVVDSDIADDDAAGADGIEEQAFPDTPSVSEEKAGKIEPWDVPRASRYFQHDDRADDKGDGRGGPADTDLGKGNAGNAQSRKLWTSSRGADGKWEHDKFLQLVEHAGDEVDVRMPDTGRRGGGRGSYQVDDATRLASGVRGRGSRGRGYSDRGAGQSVWNQNQRHCTQECSGRFGEPAGWGGGGGHGPWVKKDPNGGDRVYKSSRDDECNQRPHDNRRNDPGLARSGAYQGQRGGRRWDNADDGPTAQDQGWGWQDGPPQRGVHVMHQRRIPFDSGRGRGRGWQDRFRNGGFRDSTTDQNRMYPPSSVPNDNSAGHYQSYGDGNRQIPRGTGRHRCASADRYDMQPTHDGRFVGGWQKNNRRTVDSSAGKSRPERVQRNEGQPSSSRKPSGGEPAVAGPYHNRSSNVRTGSSWQDPSYEPWVEGPSDVPESKFREPSSYNRGGMQEGGGIQRGGSEFRYGYQTKFERSPFDLNQEKRYEKPGNMRNPLPMSASASALPPFNETGHGCSDNYNRRCSGYRDTRTRSQGPNGSRAVPCGEWERGPTGHTRFNENDENPGTARGNWVGGPPGTGNAGFNRPSRFSHARLYN